MCDTLQRIRSALSHQNFTEEPPKPGWLFPRVNGKAIDVCYCPTAHETADQVNMTMTIVRDILREHGLRTRMLGSGRQVKTVRVYHKLLGRRQ